MRRPALILIAGVAAVMLAAAKPAKTPSAAKRRGAPAAALADSSIGLSRTSVFSVPAPLAYAAPADIPGQRPKLPRAYPGAPPRIPHGILDFLPITRAQNACLECHDRATAAENGVLPIPASHYHDLRRAPDAERETIAGARYVCVSCHVPQTDAPPLVGNTFGR